MFMSLLALDVRFLCFFWWKIGTQEDDATLLVPGNSDIDLATEFNHIKDWAVCNHLKINTNKTKEIVLCQPRAQYFHMLALLDGVEHVDCFKLLGVTFQNNSKFDAHDNFLLRQYSQRLYLLKTPTLPGNEQWSVGPGHSCSHYILSSLCFTYLMLIFDRWPYEQNWRSAKKTQM